MEQIKITTEEEAFKLLKSLVEGQRIEDVESIQFENWPKFVIRISGEGFKGTIPTRIMPSLLELQREVHKVYCLTVYGEESTRKLTKKDREQLELVVKVDEGSSWFETLLDDKVIKIIQDATSKMSPEQITIVAVVFGFLIASTIGWKAWLNKKAKDKELDSELEKTIELSKLEKEKLEVISKATSLAPVLNLLTDSVNNLRGEFTAKLKAADNLEISSHSHEKEVQNIEPVNISGEQAAVLTETTRQKAVETKVDGLFLLLSADFTDKEGLKVMLRRQSDSYEFKARVPLGVLGEEQSDIIKEESWNKKPMQMELLAKELHNKYTSATVISVKFDEK